MSLEDLEQAGVTLPRDQWGKRRPRPAMNKPLFIVTVVAAVTAAVMMYMGRGGSATWIGALLFLAALLGATALSLHATTAQGRGSGRGGHPPRRQDRG